MPGSSGRLGSALLAVCRLQAPDVEIAQRQDFSLQLRRHRLQPLAHLASSRAGRASAAGAEAGFLEAVGAHTRNLAALRALNVTFDGLVWVVLKGPVLSELAHPVPGVRQYADIDVLIDPGDLRKCIHRLQRDGWRQLDGNHRLLLQRMPGELHFLGLHGAQVDLHWSVSNNRAARSASSFSTSEILARRTVRTIANLELPTMDDVDGLLHLCVHAAHAGADRLLWLLDVDQWMGTRHIDWTEFLRRAGAAGMGPAAFVVLGRARRTFDSPVPVAVMRELSGRSPWHVAEGVLRTVQPVEQVARERSAARLIARASRRDGASSSRELFKRLSSSVRHQHRVDSSWREDPDAEAWEEFLSRVEQGE